MVTKTVMMAMSDSELEEAVMRRQGEMLPNRRDLFATHAPPMPGWWWFEYSERNGVQEKELNVREYLEENAEQKQERYERDRRSMEAKVRAEIQWRWEFAEMMVRMEHERK